MLNSAVVWLRNQWVKIPDWFRAAIVYAVTVTVALGQKFTWTFPASFQEAASEVGAFLVILLPALVAVFRTRVLPFVVNWYMDTFGVSDAREIGSASTYTSGRVQQRTFWFIARD